MTPLPKNTIIESVINSGALFKLYYFLENDEPLYYTFKEQNIPLSNNVYPLQKGKIILAPTKKEQARLVDERILDLYDDLTPDLKDYALKLLELPQPLGIEQLTRKLTQYEPKEVYNYLMDSLADNTLHNYAEFEDIDKLQDEKSGCHLKTYKFCLKGEFKSFGCTTTINGKAKCYLYDNDKNYSNALKHFGKEVDICFNKMLTNLSQKNMEM